MNLLVSGSLRFLRMWPTQTISWQKRLDKKRCTTICPDPCIETCKSCRSVREGIDCPQWRPLKTCGQEGDFIDLGWFQFFPKMFWKLSFFSFFPSLNEPIDTHFSFGLVRSGKLKVLLPIDGDRVQVLHIYYHSIIKPDRLSIRSIINFLYSPSSWWRIALLI